MTEWKHRITIRTYE